MSKMPKKPFTRNFLVWTAITLLLLLIFELSSGARLSEQKISFSDFMDAVDAGQIQEVTFRGDSLEGKTTDGKRFNLLVPYYPELVNDLRQKGVKIDKVATESSLSNLFSVILSWFPVLLLVGVWIYFMRGMQSGGNRALGFGKSKAKLVAEKDNKITFKDVAGIDEAKEELTEVVDFLREPAKFQKLGGKIPKGCLLIGAPGTGKTLLAKAIAGEAKVPFFSISGSDFVEMFVGVGASRVRDMFEQARKNAPCIVFIDEIDAVGRHRGAGLGGGNDEREQTLNQLLVEMDGFSPQEGIIVIAATNRPDVLDPALLRPGRFDRQIVVPLPDISGREQILNVHSKKVPLAEDVDLRTIARGTPGFSGADLANLVNEAALLAARKNQTIVGMKELEDAKDKVMMGAERRSLIMTEEQKKLTAYHEGGHALVAYFLPDSDKIHKVTIVPRGRALGMVMRLPEDELSATKAKYKADLAVAMGGRVAEEIIFGSDKITSGAASDIKMATRLARHMVTQWGFDKEIGPVLVGDEREEVFLGHSWRNDGRNSEELSKKVDNSIKKFIDEAYNTAQSIINGNLDKLHLLAKTLLERETLTGPEVNDLLTGKKIKEPSAKEKKANDEEGKIDIVETRAAKSSKPKGGNKPAETTS